jgi:hypothetical protein
MPPALDVWRKPSLTYTFFAICLVLSVWWWRHIPYPDVPFLALAVAALIVTLRGEMKPHEKSLWFVAFCLFVAVEMRSLRYAEDSQRDAFAKIGGQITKAIDTNDQHFSDTMGKLNAALQELTGGDSYMYFRAADPVEVGKTHAGGKNQMFFALGYPLLVGDYPLHDVTCSGQDIGTGQPWDIPYGTLYPNELGRPRMGHNFVFDEDISEPVHLSIFISASNGSYYEQFMFKKNKENKWRMALRVMKYSTAKNQKTLREWKDKDYPDRLVDWRK